jgi:hypothetical protein
MARPSEAPKEPARPKAASLRTKVPSAKAKAAAKQLKKKKQKKKTDGDSSEDSADEGDNVLDIK